MAKPITVSDVPSTLLEAARRVTDEGDRVPLVINGMIVALVPVEDAEYMEALEDAKDTTLAEEAMEDSRWSGEPNVPAEALFRELERENGMAPDEADASMKAFVDQYRAALLKA
jgi:hypothetical protein